MKENSTTIDVSKNTRDQVNQMKYKLGMKTQDATLLFLIQFYEMKIKKGNKK